MSATSTAFGRSSPTRYWIYYTLKNTSQLENALRSHSNDYPVVLMFWAAWSEPCKAMRGVFRQVALNNKRRAIFCLVDVDSFRELAEQYGAEALPTFVVIKNGAMQGKVVGIKEQELKRAVQANL